MSGSGVAVPQYFGDELAGKKTYTRQVPDPDFAGIESLAIRPRTSTAPDIPRP